MTGEDARKIPALRLTQDTFRAAIPHFDHRCEIVEIPYEGVKLSGYFVPSRVGSGRLPTILYLNGADSLSEEAYFTVALPASMIEVNGMNALHPEIDLHSIVCDGRLTLEDIEREVIVATIEHNRGHRQRSASALGIGVRTLGLKLKKWKEQQLVDASL